MNRMQIAEQFRKAVQMYAATLTDTQAVEVASLYDPWTSGKTYGTGALVTYGLNGVGDPRLYRVVQAHTSQQDWTPDVTPAIYTAIGLDDLGYPLWSQPAGAHDAYSLGDTVNYNGILYRSLIDGNVYSPGENPAYWEMYTNKEETA